MGRATLVWAALVLATGVTLLVGGSRWGAAAAVVIGMAKVMAIGWEFMEVRRAPAVLRRLFLGWSSVLAVVLVIVVAAT